MPHTEETLRQHPFVSAYYKRFGSRGGKAALRMPATGVLRNWLTSKNVKPFVITPASKSRWDPHQGEREMARQMRKAGVEL